MQMARNGFRHFTGNYAGTGGMMQMEKGGSESEQWRSFPLGTLGQLPHLLSVWLPTPNFSFPICCVQRCFLTLAQARRLKGREVRATSLLRPRPWPKPNKWITPK
jgi:hypothetical protein